MRATQACAWAVAVSLAAGCAGLAPPAAPEWRDQEADLPQAWSAIPQASQPNPNAMPPQSGWQCLQDPLLAQWVDDALRTNPTAQGAAAALRQARALRDVAATGLQPQVGSSASVQRNYSGQSLPGASRSNNAFQVGLDASWELDLFGVQRHTVAAADAVAEASLASLAEVQVSLAAEVGLSALALRSAQVRSAVAERNLASQRQTLQITQWRVQAGLLGSLEAEQARSNTALLSAQTPLLQISIAQAAHALAVLTGRPPLALQAVADGSPPAAGLPQASASRADEVWQAPAEVLRQRADVRVAEQQVLAAHSRLATADAARLPNFHLGGSMGLGATTLAGLGHGAALAASVLGGVAWPLWDGGAARAQVAVQRAAMDQALATYRSTLLAALQEVEDALAARRGQAVRLAWLQDAEASATRAATLARQRFASGLVDFQTVLETQRTQFNAQDSLASAQTEVGLAHVHLFKALGGNAQAAAHRPTDGQALCVFANTAAPVAVTLANPMASPPLISDPLPHSQATP